MQNRKAAVAVGSTLLGIGQSFAALDLSPVTAAVDVGTISVAIIAMAAIMAGPNVAKWAGKKLANFFG